METHQIFSPPFPPSIKPLTKGVMGNQGKVENKGLVPSLISSFFPKKGEQLRKEGDTSLASCLLPSWRSTFLVKEGN